MFLELFVRLGPAAKQSDGGFVGPSDTKMIMSPRILIMLPKNQIIPHLKRLLTPLQVGVIPVA
jgi:hypothetical protein